MLLTPMRSQLIIALALCAGVAQSRAQEEDYRQSIGGSLSVGSKISKDADFWGWSLSISLAYDEETEERRNQSDKVTQFYTPTVAWTYPVSPRWAVGAGVGKGVINDDNKHRVAKLPLSPA